MRYFSEDNDFVNAECEHCKKVLKIKREQTIPAATGFSLNPPGGIRCFCGVIHHSIAGTTLTPSVLSNIPKCPTCQSTHVEKISKKSKVGKVALFGVFAIGGISKTFKCNNCGYKW